jgi:hypothetical protein
VETRLCASADVFAGLVVETLDCNELASWVWSEVSADNN